ncbi:sarcosine dehydrogenase, mitochondrial isoform X6 [Talpa occidentalis]|uniref:sarcosine dehydrogenase, mitochondrial isoform X6 n=1 Tax=Talpa occidentalis TaxID=50954 RepID=UPI0023FA2A84|nr:sarcosine dehydrogenase, mitochondrial isoform X6 [Talpa occidentalis]
MHAPLNWPGIFGLLPRSAGPSQPDARSTLLSTATGQTWGGGEWPQPGSHFSPPPARLSLAPAALAAGVTMASLSRALRVAATRPRGSPALRPLTSAAGPTAEKSVPYQRTLKEGSSEVASGPSRPLPSTANVVVIGGGSLGCQTLYHLAKLGVSGAVLLERDRLTSGTTWHTAGLLWQLRPSDVEVELLAHTRRVVSRDLEQETGLHTGWIQNGGLFIASNRQRLDEYKRLMSLGKAYGVESHVLGPEETKALYPLMNVDDLYGTLYVPHDGTMDPAGTCTTLTRAATARGAQVIENCPVTGIRVRTDDFGVRRVAAVETEHGTIQTPCVVNCAGVWAGAVGRMAGVKVPLVAMHHAYVVTERIEGIQNMPNVRDHDASVYLRLQGDALSVGGYENNPIFWEEVSDKFAFGLFDLDWDVFTQHIEGAINRVPVLEKTGIKSTVCGPESFTPDHKPLMGEAPELRGFFLGCGFNSAGMMLGGGCGQELAHWIIHGRPEKDMYGYDIRRFHHSLTDHRRWVRERSHESYAKNYSVVFPHDEPLAGRNMRTDALHQELLARGCVFQERHGWERPGWFSPRGTAPVLDYDYYGAYGNQRRGGDAYSQLLGEEYTFDFPPHHDVPGHSAGGAGYRPEQRGFPFLHPQAGEGRWAPGAGHEAVLRGGAGLGAAHPGAVLRARVPGRDGSGRQARPRQRRLPGHRLSEHRERKVPMFGLEAIWRNGQVVGHVRRADFGFTLDKTVAYGYIRDPSGGPVSPDFVKSGDYALERMGVTYPARAHLKSPFDPDNKRVKGLY